MTKKHRPDGESAAGNDSSSHLGSSAAAGESGDIRLRPGISGPKSPWTRLASSTLLWGTLVAVLVFVVAVVHDQRVRARTGSTPARAALAQGAVGSEPLFSSAARQGQEIFQARCAICHGQDAVGSRQGPPLIHPSYGASKFADERFVAAVRNGVVARQWTFGDMPAIPGVGDQQLALIVRYIREQQVAQGVE